MSYHLDTLLDSTRRAACASNARAMAFGQAAWDNASPPEADIEAELRDSFAAAMAGDMLKPAVWAYCCTWLKRESAVNADVLGDVMKDDAMFLRRAMVILARVAKGEDAGYEATELITQAGSEFARRNS